MALARGRRILFAAVAATGTFLVCAGALFALDLYLHSRFQRAGVVNLWGYRGPLVGRKPPGERRVAFLGGSTAFGFGVTWEDAIPGQLEQRLRARVPDGLPSAIRVLNLGYNNEGAYAFRFTLADYSYLRYDVVCFYEGYNDLAGDELGPNLTVFRHASPVFRMTGYMPIFPIIFREKAAALRYGGDVDAIYRGDAGKTVFHPGLAQRAVAGALDATVTVSQSLEAQFGRAALQASASPRPADGRGCAAPWSHYCRSLFDAVDDALGAGRPVLVITQPYLPGQAGERHRDQQRAMATALGRRYGSNPRVQYVNLGTAIDLRDRTLAFDGMHLTAAGNAVVADRLTGPVLAALESVR